MSDWEFLNKNRMGPGDRSVDLRYATYPDDGFNGLFRFTFKGYPLRCLASDGASWQHVSVSIEGKLHPPNWETMCAVKDLFWNDDEAAIQFHPRKKEAINWHPGCLHIWRYIGMGGQQPEPHWSLVGPKITSEGKRCKPQTC